MSPLHLTIIPGVLWLAALIFQADRLCSQLTRIFFVVASVVCMALGIFTNHQGSYPKKGGFFVVVFVVPLIFVGISEIFRLIYISIRHEIPCINVRSGRWIGDPPVNGHWTKFPPGKVISWADVLFGLTQWVVPLAAAMVLIIWSLAATW